jgi:hypothetical protein
MSEIEHRPLTAAERSSLTKLGSRREELINHFSGVGCTFMLLFAAAAWIVRLAGWNQDVLPGLALVLLCVALLVMWRTQRTSPSWSAPYREDLGRNQVELATFDVVDAIRVEEAEDEGSQYYLRLADGRVLFLAGQYLYDVEEEGRFPSTRIRTTRGTASRLLFEIECPGEPLEPSSTRRSFSREEHRSGLVPADGEMVEANFDQLRNAP